MKDDTAPAVVVEAVKPAPKKSSRLKAVDPKTAEPSRLKMLVFGKSGIGKTWGSLDFPAPYYIDTEGGANLPHYTDKLKKAGGVYFGPDQGSQDFKEVIDQVKALATEQHPYKTLIIDSLSKLHNLEVNKEAERLGDKDGFGASKKPALRLTGTLIRWIDKIDMNVILTAHERPLWAGGEQTGVTYDGGEKVEYELNLAVNIIRTGEARRAIIQKTRLAEFPLGGNFLWSYPEFADRYGRERVEGAVKSIVLANPEQIAEVKKLLETVKLSEATQDKWIAENAENLAEIETEKVAKIITHLRSKIAS